jgi:transcription elongation factor Elf1
MSESKRVPRDLKPKKVKYINGKLGCQRCGNTWDVVDLNPERKAVSCPVCGELNDIREALKAA